MNSEDTFVDDDPGEIAVTVGMFADRTDAGRRLARRLRHLRGADVVVVGLPSGGVVVASEVARELQARLDVIVVRKLGVPFQPELAMGAIGEDGARAINGDVVRAAGITPQQLAAVEHRERGQLQRRVLRLRGEGERTSLTDRVVVIVDDGVATGATADAACQVARAQGAARVILAVPVAPAGWERRFAGVADELICVATPSPFDGIGRFYRNFSQLGDEDVVACLARADRTAERTVGTPRASAASTGWAAGGEPDPQLQARDEDVCVSLGTVELPGQLTVPQGATGVVIFAHGSGSSRHSPRNRLVARRLNRAGLATMLFDLLTAAEGGYRVNVFDIELLAGRLAGATAWLREQPGFAGLPVGWFGASTGAAAALWAAAEPGTDIAAVVSRGGRPDLAGNRLAMVRAPTLLIVGGLDALVLEMNRQALDRLRCEAHLAVVPDATHLFEEPGTLEAAADAARVWFLAHLRRGAGAGRPE
jgi:putative phosphoribosyl transferase